MKIVFLGPPGSGKGTYSTRIASILGIPHISTGDILRENVKNGTELGKVASNYMERGELVPDEIVIGMLKERIKKEDCKSGFVLDGFPRTLHQAEELGKITNIDAVINLDVPDEVVVKRLSARRVCERCGAVYNLITLKPKVEGICDKCGGKLVQRKDDKPEVIKERLEVYKKTARSILEFYKGKGKLHNIEITRVDAPIQDGLERILKVLKSLNAQ